ncbi:hypothetical protein C4K12_5372 [Pseudomonas chlororaphis subsp. aureofaciens]|nr:hypothetical protein C4K12_5372 [Pseudomonas chlororaphis subsp. aureofaciens]
MARTIAAFGSGYIDCVTGLQGESGQKKGSSRNSGKHRNKNADLIDDVRASKHI